MSDPMLAAFANPTVNGLVGGCLIGLASILALYATGKIAGISGVVAKVIRPARGDVLWRVIFLVGMILGAALLFQLYSPASEFEIPGGREKIWVFVLAGLLVGYGARLGGGCTSGHGVCGIGAGAKDSIVATLVFMAAGAAAVLIWNLTFASSS